MTVERLNDNQIKVIVSEQDLTERNLKITELAYRADEWQALYSDVMAAAREIGGFSDDGKQPLIIEATPTSEAELTIIISKMNFMENFEASFNLLPFMKPEVKLKALFHAALSQSINDMSNDAAQTPTESAVSIFVFKTLDSVIDAAHRLEGYDGENSLYKLKNEYYLILHSDEKRGAVALSAVEGMLSDYAKKFASTPVSETYVMEHGELISERAVQKFLTYM